MRYDVVPGESRVLEGTREEGEQAATKMAAEGKGKKGRCKGSESEYLDSFGPASLPGRVMADLGWTAASRTGKTTQVYRLLQFGINSRGG